MGANEALTFGWPVRRGPSAKLRSQLAAGRGCRTSGLAHLWPQTCEIHWDQLLTDASSQRMRDTARATAESRTGSTP